MGGRTSNESKAKYNAKAYDRIEVVVKKGEKEKIKACAESNDMSLNAFINQAIEHHMAWWDEHDAKLPPGKAWYKSEEGREAISKLREDKEKNND